MAKRYLLALIISIPGLGMHLQALEELETQEKNSTSLTSTLIDPQMPLEKKLYLSEIFVMLQKNNNQSNYILIAPVGFPDTFLKAELQKLGLNTAPIIDLKKMRKERSMGLDLFLTECTNLTLSIISSVILGFASGYLIFQVFEKKIKEEGKLFYYSVYVGVGVEMLLYYTAARWLSHWSSKRQKYENYFNQIKTINFNNSSIAILKVPNKFIASTIKLLKKKGFELVDHE